VSFGAFSYSVAVLVSGAWMPLRLKAGSRVTLDEGWAPYCQATVTIATPSSTALQDALDPRTPTQVRIVTADLRTGYSRSFTLWLRSRKLNHVANETTLELASGEARLQDLANATGSTDTSFRQYQSSVRAIVNQVLGRLGYALEPGTADADFTTLTAVSNLITNPSAEVNATDWTAGNGCTIARVTTQHFVGVASIAATATATSLSVFATNLTTYLTASAGRSYTGQIWALPNFAGMTIAVTVRYLDTNGNTLLNATGAAVALPLGAGWTRVRSATSVAPAGTAKIALYASVAGTAAGRVTYLDAAMLVEGDGLETDGTPLAYFDGSTPDTALYNYDWSGTANASASARSPVFQRDPATLAWDPGESAWSFLQPVLTQAGLRLYCDETGKWFLVDPSYLVDGLTVIAEGYNAVEAGDTIARDSEDWADSVVVRYAWTDTANTQQTRFDVATTGVAAPKTMLIEYARPYPGPGAAKYILAKLQGHGRVLDLVAITDLTTTPSKPLSATLPDTPVQTGVTSAVTWDLAADEMTVKSRGLTDTPPDSWLFMPETLTWADIPDAATWNTWTF
jgi:hypothetical protein